MLALETDVSLAVFWSGAGLAQSLVLRSTAGRSGVDLAGAAETVLSPCGDGPVAYDESASLDGPDVSGQRLGRYRLIERLGRGCQGDVWRAIPIGPAVGDDVGAGEGTEAAEVALKLLPPSLARDPRRLAQFRREAERRARLAVPSVLPTSEFGEADGIVFMVMPLVDGCSLGEIIAWRRAGGLGLRVGGPPNPRHPLADAPEAEYLRGVVRVVAGIARTLDHVHAARVVHRDIKPANILLDRRREDGIFLCDFGLGRDLDVATAEQLRDGSGTPLYMPPERLLRLDADEVRCDVYSLGATLYEAVTLVPPVQLPESLPWPAWTSYLASTPPARPQSVRPDLPDALEAIILRAMSHDPGQRHPAAAQLADDLERFLDRLGENDGGVPASRNAAAPVSRPAARTRALDLTFPWECPGIDDTSPSWPPHA